MTFLSLVLGRLYSNVVDINIQSQDEKQAKISMSLDFNSTNDNIFKNLFGKTTNKLKLENKLFNTISKLEFIFVFNCDIQQEPAKGWQDWNGNLNAPLFHYTFDISINFSFNNGSSNVEVPVYSNNHIIYYLVLIMIIHSKILVNVDLSEIWYCVLSFDKSEN